MKINFHIHLLIVLFLAAVLPYVCIAANIDKKIERSYLNSNYATAVKLLEEKIHQLKIKSPAGQKNTFQYTYMNKLLLAHIYAWKLNKTERALKIYEEVVQLKKTRKERIRIPSLELLYIAELYETKNDFKMAEKKYLELLKGLLDLKAGEHDDVMVIFADEFIKFAKYQIDGIRLKTGGEQMLKKLKLSSLMIHNIAPFFAMGLVPAARYETTIAMKTDLPSYIKQSTRNISSMIFCYALIVNEAGGIVDKSSEGAMKAYLSKYSEGYFAISLRYLFYKFYEESGQEQKADIILAELNSIAQKRDMEIAIRPDKRFSSPEKTWETYIRSMIEGDVELAMECHIPGNKKYKEIFRVMGKDKMKKMAAKMNPIKKIIIGQQEAEYLIIRQEHGNRIGYSIYFSNINGEWKIVRY